MGLVRWRFAVVSRAGYSLYSIRHRPRESRCCPLDRQRCQTRYDAIKWIDSSYYWHFLAPYIIPLSRFSQGRMDAWHWKKCQHAILLYPWQIHVSSHQYIGGVVHSCFAYRSVQHSHNGAAFSVGKELITQSCARDFERIHGFSSA